MLIFCALTQFLLLTIIICLLSNSLEKVCAFPPRVSATLKDVRELTKSAFDRSWSMHEMNTGLCEWQTDRVCCASNTNNGRHSYAVYVLEASTSNRLTYFVPPLVSKPSTLASFLQSHICLATLHWEGDWGASLPFEPETPSRCIELLISVETSPFRPIGAWRLIC